MQQQRAEVAPDQKEDEKRPDTPPLILDDATPQNSDASGPSYSSTFQQDVMQNPQSETRSGRKFIGWATLDHRMSHIHWGSPDSLGIAQTEDNCALICRSGTCCNVNNHT